MLDISVSHVEGNIPISVLTLSGELDGSNYFQLIDSAKELKATGNYALVLDMADLRFMSSAGLVAMHNVVMLFRGETPTDTEQGWAALHALEKDRDSGAQPFVRLANLQSRVNLVLETTGIKSFFHVHASVDEAIASFEPR